MLSLKIKALLLGFVLMSSGCIRTGVDGGADGGADGGVDGGADGGADDDPISCSLDSDCSDGEVCDLRMNICYPSSPILYLSDARFSFPSAPPGAPAMTEELTVRNDGDLDLTLTSFDFDLLEDNSYVLDYQREGSEERLIGFDPTQEEPNLLANSEITLAPDESLTFFLTYTPDNAGAGRAIRFATNDENHPYVTLPITGAEASSELRVTPTQLNFGYVNAGEVVERELTVTNVGSAISTLDLVRISPTMSDFSVTLNGVNPIDDPSVLVDPDGDGVDGLSAMASFTMIVKYAPPVQGPDSGVLEILEANGGLRSVPLRANDLNPCINLLFPDTPHSNADELDFGPSLVESTRIQDVVVESCGGQTLEISAIRVEGAEFGLGDGLPPSYPARLPPVTDGYVTANSFQVTFTPPELDLYSGTLIVESNDPMSPVLEIPLRGRGSMNACPVAEVARAELMVSPLEIVTLDGSSSVDPDGPNGIPVRYSWSVTQRPAGSTAQPVERLSNSRRPADGGVADDTTTPQAFFFVDVAGEYLIELTVEDDQGFSSAECADAVATLHINARPESAVHVELTWHTPSDEDETDLDGTDVDLHLLHPSAMGWANGLSELDCHYANINPDWGPAGPDGNPSLDIDDANGAGPENITIDTPEVTNNGYYRVGVHYYSSGDSFFGEDYGPSDSTIRIYLEGVLSGEWIQRLNSTGSFWEVAGIEWGEASSRVIEINRLYGYIP